MIIDDAGIEDAELLSVFERKERHIKYKVKCQDCHKYFVVMSSAKQRCKSCIKKRLNYLKHGNKDNMGSKKKA